MQRRVAAMYFVFFLVLGAGAFSVITLADAPTVQVDGKTYAANDTFRAGGQQYTVAKVSESGGTLKYTNQSFRYTATLKNNSTVNYTDTRYRVLIENRSNVSSFQLRETLNVTAILQNDSAVYNQTTTIEGKKYVTYRENNTNRLLSEYLPEPETRQFGEGDKFRYKGNRTTVANVTSAQVTLERIAPKNQTIQLSEGGNVTLADGNQYFAHFQTRGGQPRVTLAQTQQAYTAYANEVAEQRYFHERISGLWGVVYLSAIAAILVVALATMPVKG